MPTRPLPTDPSLENLKNQARSLLKAVRAGDSAGIAMVREFHPRADETAAQFQLADAQLAIARSYRFASWPKLKQYLAMVTEFLWDPPADPGSSGESPVDRLLRLSCLSYGAWRLEMAGEARRMLAGRPDLGTADLYAACTVGEVEAVREMLARDRAAANRKGGVLRWEPLLYCCYSRLNSTDARHSTLEVARLLLANGADPNAGFLWRGNIPAFTALTGAFGEGEAGAHNPPHQHRDALVRLLLDAGADPNDGQALYNTGAPVEVLRLLFADGLGRDKGGPWIKRMSDRLSREQMLEWELWRAAHNNEFEKVKILVEHGVDVNQATTHHNRTPYEEAIIAGNDRIAAYLLEHGSRKLELDETERFESACVAGRREEALAILRKTPRLIEELGEQRRTGIVHKAARGGRPEAVRLVAELGFDLNTMTHGRTPLHDAAWANRVEMIKLLIELGADPAIRDITYHGRPLDWAEFNRQPAAAEYLRSVTRE
jgi:ankyrin repeat protein